MLFRSAFHRGLWEASENQILLRQWPSMEAHIALAIAEDEAARPDPVRVRHTHQALLEAIMSGDIERAKLALLEHTVDNAEQLAALVRANAIG